jgi:hypothetical protein
MARNTNMRILVVFMALTASAAGADTVVLYDQGFEAPKVYNNDGGDVNIFDTVNDNYGGQPAGFSFAQANTVETLNVSGSRRGAGTAAFGTGYTDPGGTGGDFAIGMLSSAQNDLLGLAFDLGDFPFFNVSVDVSSIDLSVFGGPFVPSGGLAPEFKFTLFDNPSGSPSVSGSGLVLDQKTLTGTASERSVFDWTSEILAFDTEGNSNGNVVLQIDLLVGGYAAFDNLRIAASDDEGDVGGPSPVPLPATLPMLLAGSALLFRLRKRAI